MMDGIADLPYRLAWRARTARAGAHRSSVAGSGGMFRDMTSLLDARDPRRIDLHHSLRDPFDNVHVRRFEQSSCIGVTLLADVSASMTFSGHSRKTAQLCELADAIAMSAARTGDTFQFFAADGRVREELSAPPTRSRSSLMQTIARLRQSQFNGSESAGLLNAANRIGARRGLVFVVSDFLMAQSQLEVLFERLSRHDVVPVALYDSAEIEALPEWGLMELADLETGRRRLVVLRPSLKAAWHRRIEARRSAFRNIARRFGREPFEVTDRIAWDRLAAHLMAGQR